MPHRCCHSEAWPLAEGKEGGGEGEGIAVDAVSHALLLGASDHAREAANPVTSERTAGYYAKSIKFRYKDLDSCPSLTAY